MYNFNDQFVDTNCFNFNDQLIALPDGNHCVAIHICACFSDFDLMSKAQCNYQKDEEEHCLFLTKSYSVKFKLGMIIFI